MADFEERITRTSSPSARLEHEVRYRAASPILGESELWCDLGCGNGLAARAALDGGFAGRVLLVDVVDQALHEAETQIEASDVRSLRADLAANEGVALVREALLADPPDHGCITGFELLEHLTSFVPLLELLVEAATIGRYTVVLSVPNDAYESMQNPYHLTTWGEDAFEELRRLLPEGHVLAHQLELRGSTLLRPGADRSSAREATFSFPETVVASHFLAAFGPRAELLGEPTQVRVADREGQRAWERQRDSDLAYFRALAKKSEPRPTRNETDGVGDSPAAR
jgi:hypothetical protein